MADLPLVIILLLTYASNVKRTEYALETVRQTKELLSYPNLKWYVADAGESDENFNKILNEIGMDILLGAKSQKRSAGKCWNDGIREAFRAADIYLRLEDDWAMGNQLNICPIVRLLNTHEDIGMVRFGYQHVTQNQHEPIYLEAIGIDGIHYLRYMKISPFCYGGHPSLIHRRFHDAYGYNDEQKNPGEIEIDMDERVRNMEGPEIIRPHDIGGWGIWQHIGAEKGY